jgi:hypothetical protein
VISFLEAYTDSSGIPDIYVILAVPRGSSSRSAEFLSSFIIHPDDRANAFICRTVLAEGLSVTSIILNTGLLSPGQKWQHEETASPQLLCYFCSCFPQDICFMQLLMDGSVSHSKAGKCVTLQYTASRVQSTPVSVTGSNYTDILLFCFYFKDNNRNRTLNPS